MKKFLLLGAAAMLACSANAQSLVEKWSVDLAGKGNEIRTVAGFGDKVYVAHAANSVVAQGYIEVYKDGNVVETIDVNGFLKEQGILKQEMDEAKGELVWNGNMMWTAVTTDDADNIMVNVGTAGSSKSCNYWVYIPASDRKAMQFLEIEDFASADFTTARYDVPCRMVGNIAEGGAYLFIAAANATQLPCMYVFLDEDGKITYDPESSWVLPCSTLNSSSNAATFATVDEIIDADDESVLGSKTYTYTRLSVPQAWDADNATLAPSSVLAKEGNCAGMDVFEIDGVKYMAVKTEKLGLRGASFNVYNIETGEVVAGYDAKTVNNNYVGSLQAHVNADGKSANIYTCAQGDKFALVTFTPAGSSAIEEIAADNAPVEYYNLQGVKVANPENGVFVKKQGAKAVKVVL